MLVWLSNFLRRKGWLLRRTRLNLAFLKQIKLFHFGESAKNIYLHPNPVISVNRALFSSASAKPKRSSYLVSFPAFKFPSQ